MASLPAEGELRPRNRRKSVSNEPSVADRPQSDSDVRESVSAESSLVEQPARDTEYGADKNYVDSAASGRVKKGIFAFLMRSKCLSVILKTVVIILALAWTTKSYNDATLHHTRVHMAACRQHPKNSYLQSTGICMAMAKNSSHSISISPLDVARMHGQIGNLNTSVWFQNQTRRINMPIGSIFDLILTCYYLWSMVNNGRPFKGLILYSILQYVFGAWRLGNNDVKETTFWGWLFQEIGPGFTNDYREAVSRFRYNLVFPVVGYFLCQFIVPFYRFLPSSVIRTSGNKDGKPEEKGEVSSTPKRKRPTGWLLFVAALATAATTTSLLAPLAGHLTPGKPAITYAVLDEELDDAVKALQATPFFILHEVRSVALKVLKEGDIKRTEKMLRQVLRGYENWVGSEHDYAINTARDLVQVVHRLQRYSEAAVLHRRVLERYKTRFGEDHSNTILVKLELSFALHEDGKFTESLDLRKEVLDWQDEHLGPESIEALVSCDNIGLSLAGMKSYKDAEIFHRRALTGKRNTLGDSHPQTLSSLNNLGITVAGSGRYQEAEEMLQDVLRRRERVLGSEDLNTLETAHMLGVLLDKLGRQGESEHMFRRALHGRNKHLGSHHPRTRTTLQYLVHMLGEQGREEDVSRLIRSLTRDD